jgi:hypothetical protein
MKNLQLLRKERFAALKMTKALIPAIIPLIAPPSPCSYFLNRINGGKSEPRAACPGQYGVGKGGKGGEGPVGRASGPSFGVGPLPQKAASDSLDNFGSRG